MGLDLRGACVAKVNPAAAHQGKLKLYTKDCTFALLVSGDQDGEGSSKGIKLHTNCELTTQC